MSRILLKEGGVFGNTDSGGVWLSVRFVRCWVKSHNATVKFETLSKFLMISRRKVRMTSSHHALTNSFFFFFQYDEKVLLFHFLEISNHSTTRWTDTQKYSKFFSKPSLIICLYKSNQIKL
jgi:hypothetical protein